MSTVVDETTFEDKCLRLGDFLTLFLEESGSFFEFSRNIGGLFFKMLRYLVTILISLDDFFGSFDLLR